jgi:hypothetical protein
VALRWAACNSGAVERVTLRAPASSGLRGMSVESGTGPSQVRDVTVDGFAVGIWGDATPVNNLVFTGVTLRNQRSVAIQNGGRVLQFEGLTVTGTPKAYEATGSQAVGQFIDATVTGTGSGTAMSAVAGSYLYARNITASGWGNLITTGTTNRFVGKTSIAEWASADFRRGNTSVAWTETSTVQSLNLAHPDAPRSTDYDLTHWVRANATSGNPSDDDGPAIQAAIDSGKRVVYLPYGDYTIKTPVIVRGNVEAIDFMGSRVADTDKGKISVGNSTSSFVELRNASASLDFEQNGPDAMVVRNVGALGTVPGDVIDGASATGAVFLDNASGRLLTIDRPISVFARQLNREGRGATFSGGATVWLFGDNLEMHDGKGEPFLTTTGSTMEVLAGAWDNLADAGRFNSTTGTAIYDVTDSRVSVVIPGVHHGAAITGHWLSDVVSGNRVGDVTPSEVLVGPALRNDVKRVTLPLYVSP